MSLHRAHSLVVDDYVGAKVDETLFTNIQSRKETLGNPTDDEIRAVLKAFSTSLFSYYSAVRELCTFAVL